MSVASDLISGFFRWGDTIKDDPDTFRKYQPEALVYMCAKDVERAVRTAWHPISEPPTQDDYSGPPAPFAFQWILVRDGWGTWGPVTREQFEDVIYDPEIPEGTFYTHWARPEDVVLMPPQSTGDEE